MDRAATVLADLVEEAPITTRMVPATVQATPVEMAQVVPAAIIQTAIRLPAMDRAAILVLGKAITVVLGMAPVMDRVLIKLPITRMAQTAQVIPIIRARSKLPLMAAPCLPEAHPAVVAAALPWSQRMRKKAILNARMKDRE
jgi:hypothetical protein